VGRQDLQPLRCTIAALGVLDRQTIAAAAAMGSDRFPSFSGKLDPA